MDKTCDVTIDARKDAAGNIEFDMKYKGQETDLLQFDKSQDGIPASAEYKIVFSLRNHDGLALVFVDDPSDVMYVAKGSKSHAPKCPKNKSGNPATPFSVVDIQPAQLTVKNPDSDICFYKFVLRFKDTNNGNKIVSYDPVYDNRNGGLTSSSSTYTTVAAIGGAAVGSVLTMLVFNVGLFR